MKANKKFVEGQDGERAVSAVIGVILMVAITVAIAATVYVYVSGMMGSGVQSTPSVSMTVDKSRLTGMATISIATVTDANIDWAETNWVFTNLTHATSAGSVTNTNTDFVSGGQVVTVSNLVNSTEYRVTFTYVPTGGTMGTVTWTQ